MANELPSLLGRILRMILTLLVIGVVINDGLRVVPALSSVAAGLNDATAAALDVVRAQPTAREQAERAAAVAAEARATRLDAYDQVSGESPGTLHVRVGLTVSRRITGTVIAAPVLGLIEGLEPADWYAATGVRVALRQTKQVDVIGGASP